MKCYELKDDTLREGLLITDESGPPRINITTDGAFSLPLDPRLADVYRRAPRIASIRQHYATLGRDRKTISTPKKSDQLALLRLSVRGGENGDVSLTGCAFDEDVNLDEGRVDKLYRPFPSQGIELLGDSPEPGPWFGTDFLELALIMIPGASFRVSRSGQLHGARMHTYLYWNGYKLIDTPTKKGPPQSKEEERREAREAIKSLRRTASAMESEMAAQ